MLIFIYQIIYTLALPVLGILQFLNPKLRRGFKLRQSKNGIRPWLNHPKHSQPIWFHCASGEYEYAKPVIRALKKKHPRQPVLVTYFSPSVEKSLASAKDVDFYCPTPWDKVHLWNEFIDHHQPKSLVIARTDLWPSMLKAAKKNDLPRLLMAKTVNTKKSFIASVLEGFLLTTLTDIFCVSDMDSDLLYKKIKPYRQIHNAGDPRYDQCRYRLAHPRQLKALNNFNKPKFLAASTWPADEDLILPLIKKQIKNTSFIIAPHEPTEGHLKSLTEKLNRQEVKHQLYSQIQSWDPDAVLIIDQVGILADLYAWVQFSFVGGSVNRQVHSVLESLASGALTFIGPKHHNNRESLIFKAKKIKGIPPVQVASTSKQCIAKFEASFDLWTAEHCESLKLLVKKRSGASEIIVRWIENNLKSWT